MRTVREILEKSPRFIDYRKAALTDTAVGWYRWHRTITLHTSVLTGEFLQELEANGFVWMYPVQRAWTESLREPTVGRWVVLTTGVDVGMVHVCSPEGLRLRTTLCGF